MTAAELREKIRALALQVLGEKSQADEAALAYKELQEFPALQDIIVNLLKSEGFSSSQIKQLLPKE